MCSTGVVKEPAAPGHAQNQARSNFTANNSTTWHPLETNFAEVTSSVDDARRDAIREEFAWSWHAYERYAWTRDELKPLSQTGADWVPGGSELPRLEHRGHQQLLSD